MKLDQKIEGDGKKRKRAFPGLVGMPPEQEETPEPATEQPKPAVTSVLIPEFRSAADVLRDIEEEKREKRAKASRAFRQRRREALAKARTAMTRPIEEVRAEAEARRDAEKETERERKRDEKLLSNPHYSMGAGERMTDATEEEKVMATPMTGLGRNFDLIINHVMGQEENGGRRGKPQGVGADTSESRKDLKEDDFVGTGLKKHFDVRLDVDASQRQRVFLDFAADYYDGQGDVVCRCCTAFIERPEDHMWQVHPDLADSVLVAIQKRDRKWKMMAKAMGPTPGKLVKPTAEAAESEGFRQTGGWVQIPGGKWVQEWKRQKS